MPKATLETKHGVNYEANTSYSKHKIQNGRNGDLKCACDPSVKFIGQSWLLVVIFEILFRKFLKWNFVRRRWTDPTELKKITTIGISAREVVDTKFKSTADLHIERREDILSCVFALRIENILHIGSSRNIVCITIPN